MRQLYPDCGETPQSSTLPIVLNVTFVYVFYLPCECGQAVYIVSWYTPTIMPSAQLDVPKEEDILIRESNIRGGNTKARTRCSQPLLCSGSLNSYKHHDSTPVIGREYQDLQVADLLGASNSNQMIRDLAVTGASMFLTVDRLNTETSQCLNVVWSFFVTKM